MRSHQYRFDAQVAIASSQLINAVVVHTQSLWHQTSGTTPAERGLTYQPLTPPHVPATPTALTESRGQPGQGGGAEGMIVGQGGRFGGDVVNHLPAPLTNIAFLICDVPLAIGEIGMDGRGTDHLGAWMNRTADD